MSLLDLKNECQVSVALLPQTLATSTVNGPGCDMRGTEGPILVVVSTGANSGSPGSGAVVSLQESDDNSTFVPVGDALASPSLFAGSALWTGCEYKRAKRYVRVAVTGLNQGTLLIAAEIISRVRTIGTDAG